MDKTLLLLVIYYTVLALGSVLAGVGFLLDVKILYLVGIILAILSIFIARIAIEPEVFIRKIKKALKISEIARP